MLWGTPSHVLNWLGTPRQEHPWDVTPPGQAVNTPQLSSPWWHRTSSRRFPHPEQDATPLPHHPRAPPEQEISPAPCQPLSAHPRQDVTPRSEDLPSNRTLRQGTPPPPGQDATPSQLGSFPLKAPSSPRIPHISSGRMGPALSPPSLPRAPWVRGFPARRAGGASPAAPRREDPFVRIQPRGLACPCIPRQLQNTAGQDGTPPAHPQHPRAGDSSRRGRMRRVPPPPPGRGKPHPGRVRPTAPRQHPGQGMPPPGQDATPSTGARRAGGAPT